MQLLRKRWTWYGPTGLLLLLLGVVWGVALDHWVSVGLPGHDAAPDFRLIGQAWGLIHRFYVDGSAKQPTALTYGAISGMVNALGDTGHSRFLSPEMLEEMNELERSSFQGIGAEIQLRAGRVVIVAPMDGSPAQHAGLKPGDVIVQVNGHNVIGQSLEQVVKEVSGPAGTTVALTILTPATSDTRHVTLTRTTISIHNVTWQMIPGSNIADVRIAAFEKGVTDDLRKALTAIKATPASSVVLDLRNNPGGLLGEAVGAASQFLQGGNVLLVRNAKGQQKPVPVDKGGVATEMPVVALVNIGTASGAEIVAGALQDANRATLVGETTFGTGTVLSEFKLSDGSALLLAVEEWLTPDGHVIWHKGIVPNHIVALPSGASPVFPEAIRSMTARQLQDSHDAQLLQAMNLLKNKGSSISVAARTAVL